jgi:hypothetical protein
MGTVAVVTMALFPISAHSLPPFSWTMLTVFPASLAGMALKEVSEEEENESQSG